MNTTKDPALYRRMSEPHESQEAVNKTVEAFFDDLRVIREKHRIRDVVVTVQVAYMHEGVETVGGCPMTIGNTIEALHMAAVTYGTLRADMQAGLDTAVSVGGSRRVGKTKKAAGGGA